MQFLFFFCNNITKYFIIKLIFISCKIVQIDQRGGWRLFCPPRLFIKLEQYFLNIFIAATMALTALNFNIFKGICVHALYNMLSDLYIQYLVIKLCLKSIGRCSRGLALLCAVLFPVSLKILNLSSF